MLTGMFDHIFHAKFPGNFAVNFRTDFNTFLCDNIYIIPIFLSIQNGNIIYPTSVSVLSSAFREKRRFIKVDFIFIFAIYTFGYGSRKIKDIRLVIIEFLCHIYLLILLNI